MLFVVEKHRFFQKTENGTHKIAKDWKWMLLILICYMNSVILINIISCVHELPLNNFLQQNFTVYFYYFKRKNWKVRLVMILYKKKLWAQVWGCVCM